MGVKKQIAQNETICFFLCIMSRNSRTDIDVLAFENRIKPHFFDGEILLNLGGMYSYIKALKNRGKN